MSCDKVQALMRIEIVRTLEKSFPSGKRPIYSVLQ